MKEGLWSKRSN